MDDSDDIVKEFLVESYENLDRLDRDLITLEKNPNDLATLGSIFRTIHTIKGTSGFLAFDKLGAVAHVGENLLGRLREGELVLNPEIAAALLATVDAVRQMLASIETTGVEGERDDSELIATLTRLQSVPTGESAEPQDLKAVAAGSQRKSATQPSANSKASEAAAGAGKAHEAKAHGTKAVEVTVSETTSETTRETMPDAKCVDPSSGRASASAPAAELLHG